MLISEKKNWIKTDIIPSIIKIALIVVFIILMVKSDMSIFTIIAFILTYEVYDALKYKYKLTKYLSDFQSSKKIDFIKQKVKIFILIEFLISIFAVSIFVFWQEAYNLITFVLIIGLNSFTIKFSYKDFPKIVGDLNREKALTANNL